MNKDELRNRVISLDNELHVAIDEYLTEICTAKGIHAAGNGKARTDQKEAVDTVMGVVMEDGMNGIINKFRVKDFIGEKFGVQF